MALYEIVSYRQNFRPLPIYKPPNQKFQKFSKIFNNFDPLPRYKPHITENNFSND